MSGQAQNPMVASFKMSTNVHAFQPSSGGMKVQATEFKPSAATDAAAFNPFAVKAGAAGMNSGAKIFQPGGAMKAAEPAKPVEPPKEK